MESKRIRRGTMIEHCQPENCQPLCMPACSRFENCILGEMSVCGQCPQSKCVSYSLLDHASPENTQLPEQSKSNAGLIAGLTSGLIVGAAIFVTIAGVAFFRKQQRLREQARRQNRKPPEVPPMTAPKPTLYRTRTHPYLPPMNENMMPRSTIPTQWPQVPAPVLPSSPISPVFVPSSPLNIPRLDASAFNQPLPSDREQHGSQRDTVIRRSLTLSPTSHFFPMNGETLDCSSKTKVTTYNHSNSNEQDDAKTDNSFEDLENESNIIVCRAISLKKTTEGSLSRSDSARSIPTSNSASTNDTDESNVQLICAKPTLMRISTITDEDGVVRRASIRSNRSHMSRLSEEIADQQPNLLATPMSGRARMESWTSNCSIPQSLADGEITVLFDSSHP